MTKVLYFCYTFFMNNKHIIMIEVKFKKLHADAVTPTYSKEGDAGMDLTAVEKDDTSSEKGVIVYRTGLSVEIPRGFVGLVFPRSSISRMRVTMANAVGVIDSGYRGEILVKMKADANVPLELACGIKFDESKVYEKGDRIAQLIIIPHPQIKLIEVEELSNTTRGSGGFGSTGK